MREHLRWAFNGRLPLSRDRATLAHRSRPPATPSAPRSSSRPASTMSGSIGASASVPRRRCRWRWRANLPSGQQVATLELFGAAHYLAADSIQLGLGVGGAVAGQPGPPDFRLVFSIAYAPLRARTCRASSAWSCSPTRTATWAASSSTTASGAPCSTPPTRRPSSTRRTSARTACRARRRRCRRASPCWRARCRRRSRPRRRRRRAGRLPRSRRRGVARSDPQRLSRRRRRRWSLLPAPTDTWAASKSTTASRATLIDRPYAGVEVGADGSARAGAAAATAKAVQRSVAAIAGALPAPDSDDDGILDDDDACPDRAGVASPDPLRNGCPPALERMVVLPDPDGHVGGVEVDDGKQRTLIDQPYASAEVGADGRVRAVPPSMPRAIERAIAGLARALPIADEDGDGIRDEDDACPDRAGVAVARSVCATAAQGVRRRCFVLPDADGHVGGVEVDDGHGRPCSIAPTPRRKWAPTVARTKRRARRCMRSRRAVKSIADAMPLARPRRRRRRRRRRRVPRSRRRGQRAIRSATAVPETVEEVVVLADESGHVGGVEVDDGRTKDAARSGLRVRPKSAPTASRASLDGASRRGGEEVRAGDGCAAARRAHDHLLQPTGRAGARPLRPDRATSSPRSRSARPTRSTSSVTPTSAAPRPRTSASASSARSSSPIG